MLNKFKLDSTKNSATKEAISRTLEIANTYAGELNIEVLPLKNIELDPENKRDLILTLFDAINGIDNADPDYERKKQDWKSLESLAKTIKDDQLINPIFVYRYGNKCRLIAGERRTLASAIAGKNEIIARIASQRPVGTKLRVLQWIENNERADLSLAERIESLESIIKEYVTENSMSDVKEKITAKQLGDLTGMSVTQARRYLLILQSSLEIKRAIAQGQLENIKLIELICSIKNSKHQDELLAAAISGISFEAVLKLKIDLEIEQRNKKETRGRKKINVSLGSTKPNVIKFLINALITSNNLESNLLKQINAIKESSKWESAESVGKAFKKIISLLEKKVDSTNE